MTNVVFKIIRGRWLLCVYGKQDATNDDVSEIIKVMRTLDLSQVRMLTYTMGGTLSAQHRKEINAVVEGKYPPLAVLIGNPLARGVITALSWFNRNVKAFAPDDEFDAFAYLGIPDDLQDHCSDELHRLIDEMESRQGRPQAKERTQRLTR
jgi:hypothetical protein